MSYDTLNCDAVYIIHVSFSYALIQNSLKQEFTVSYRQSLSLHYGALHLIELAYVQKMCKPIRLRFFARYYVNYDMIITRDENYYTTKINNHIGPNGKLA